MSEKMTPAERFAERRDIERFELSAAQEHFLTSNEPLINGVPLSRYKLGSVRCSKCKEMTNKYAPCCGVEYARGE